MLTAHLAGGDLSRLRQLNAHSAIRTLRDEPSLTLTELSKRIGLSRASTEDVVRELLDLGWVTEVEPAATGVATTGWVDGSGRVLLSDALPEWTGIDLAAHVSRLVPGRVLVENDSKLAALAETWRGVARYVSDLVFILSGWRTGAGLIIGGRLHRGFAQGAGELGALPVVGWKRAPDHLAAWPSGSDIFAAARAGDRAALGAVRRYVKDLALGVSALVLTLDPELVVIGGGFSRSADVLIGPLRQELDRWVLRTPEIRVSTLADEGVALGAAKLALDSAEDRFSLIRG